jgi:hypothetical protein
MLLRSRFSPIVISEMRFNPNPRDETTKKIDSFEKFERGWRFGEGLPFSTKVLNTARTLNWSALSFGLKTDVFPRRNGDADLAIYAHGNDYSFHVLASGKIELASEFGDVETQENLSLENALNIIPQIACNRWNWSCSSVSAITTENSKDSEAARSSHPAMAPASQLLIYSARWRALAAFVSTPWISIPVSP